MNKLADPFPDITLSDLVDLVEDYEWVEIDDFYFDSQIEELFDEYL